MAAAIYTIQFQFEGTTALDGVSPLPANAVVTRNRTLGTINVVIPAGENFGRFDPGELTQYMKSYFALVSASVISAVDHVAGSFIGIRTPDGPGAAAAKVREMIDLTEEDAEGIHPITAVFYSQAHEIVLNTVADGSEGPHLIQITLVALDDPSATDGARFAFIGGLLGATGDVSNGANVGGAAEVFKTKAGTVLQFRTIEGINGTVVNQVGDVLQVDGGGGSPIVTTSFLDDTVTNVAVGDTTTDGYIRVSLSLFNSTLGEQTSYELIYGVSAGGAAFDRLESPSPSPISTVTITAVVAGSTVNMTFTGTGAGASVVAKYKVDIITRL